WNSLLTHDYSFPFRPYSDEMYPLADVMVKYINDFSAHFGIKIQFDTRVTHVSKDKDTGHFILTTKGEEFRCKALIMATGPVQPVIPDVEGIELVEGYETHDTNLKLYEGKRVVIIGHGNSAFE